MGSGRRCGCWALSELELERSRHEAVIEENKRCNRHIDDLRDELASLHSTVAELERRYSDLSSRYRNALTSLDEMTDTTERLKDQTNDCSDENRKLRATIDRLESEVTMLRDSLNEAREEAEDERRRRTATEATLSHDLDVTEKNCQTELRRAASVHDLDSQHLRQDICRLEAALEREKYRHDLTKRTLHHTKHHHHPDVCSHHRILDCPDCYCDS